MQYLTSAALLLDLLSTNPSGGATAPGETSDMPFYISRTSTSMLSGSSLSQSQQRLAQVRRHLHSTAALKREIRDAYILGAARTPTGKVQATLVQLLCCTMLIYFSSMAPFSQSRLQNLAQPQLDPPFPNPKFLLLS